MEKKSSFPYSKIIKGIWISIVLFLLLLVLFVYSVSINLFNLYGEMPTFQMLENPSNEVASELYSSDGVLLGKYFRENRSPVELDHISPHVVNALLATEDHRFYEHSGIDPEAVGRVIFKSILLLQGNVSGGGSTISQQLAKILFNTRSERYKGKLSSVPGMRMLIIKTKEWLTAVKIERSYTKEEILTMYLNTADFGSNSFGIKVAAKTYFSTTPDKIKPEEAAMLVGLLNAPTKFNPKTNPKNAFGKRNFVLSKMVKREHIPTSLYDSLIKKPIELKYKVEGHNEGLATYFRTIVRNSLLRWQKEHGYDIFEDGLKIYTTIDSRMQKYAEEAVVEHMKDIQWKFFDHWKGLNPWVDENNKELVGFLESEAKRSERYKSLVVQYEDSPDSIDIVMNTPIKMRVFSWRGETDTVLSPMDSIRYYKHFLHTGMMSMDKNGHIKAWVGGINHKHFKYDHVIQGNRQPGSTFKAFVYAAAIEAGYSPCYPVTDAPVSIKISEEEVWTPTNAENRYSGETMTMRQGLARSINSVAAQVLVTIGGPRPVIDMATRLGIDKKKLAVVPAVALGASGVSVYEMVGAYNAFNNEGTYVKPIFITRIEDKNGNLIQEFVPKSHVALNEETAYLMLHMLRGSTTEPGGTSWGLARYGLLGDNHVAAKTGTTSNHSDGWFFGITKDLTTGVWVGGDSRSIHFRTIEYGQGARMALPIWGLYMKKVLEDKTLGYSKGPFPGPPNEDLLDFIDCNKQLNPGQAHPDSLTQDSDTYLPPKGIVDGLQ